MRRSLFVLIIVFYFIIVAVGLLSGDIVRVITYMLAALSLWFTFGFVNQVIAQGSNSSPLTLGERRKVIMTEFFNPIVSGAFYYYCWKKSSPNKAKQANKYSWVILGIQVLLAIVIGVILAHFGISSQIPIF